MIRIGIGLGALCWAAGLQAAIDISISGLKATAWLQRYEAKSELSFDSVPRVGDRLITDDSGRIEVRLGADTILQINSNTEVTIAVDESSSVKGQPKLQIHKGRACVRYTAVSDIESGLEVVVGDTVFAEINIRGDICLLRRDGMSAVKLRDGNVRIEHAVDRNIVVLSSIGSEYFAEDSGEFRLNSPDVDALANSGIEKLFIVDQPPVEDEAGAEAVQTSANVSGEAAGDASEPVDELAETVPGSADIYTVYLFSTRSEDVASNVNQRFRNAGYDSQIREVSAAEEIRYRVAVPGFSSRLAAQKFADSIVGRLGVSDTWIGRDTQ